jgi:hypothetical protein
MSHPEPALTDVRTLADHPLTPSGRTSWRMVATGSITEGRFGLVENLLVQETGVHGFRNDGDEPASFLILFTPGIARELYFGELAELARSGRKPTPEEMTAFYARHDQVMVDV